MTPWVGMDQSIVAVLPLTEEAPMKAFVDIDPDDHPVVVNPPRNLTIRTRIMQALQFGNNVKVPTSLGGTPPLFGFAGNEMLKVIFDLSQMTP